LAGGAQALPVYKLPYPKNASPSGLEFISVKLISIALITNDKKGISGCQLQRELGVTYKTA
jgi:hypothetical protein